MQPNIGSSDRALAPRDDERRESHNQPWRASYADATCHKLVATPVSFLIPGEYVTRSPGQGTGLGCLWGTPADLDSVTAQAGTFDFTRIVQGVFWARATGTVGYLRGQFVSRPNKTESAERDELEHSGAKIIRYERVKGAPQPALEIVAEYQGKRVYMVYLAMGIDSNTLLINYHPPAAQPSAASDLRWQEFISGISTAQATAAAVPQASSPQPSVGGEPAAATAGFWRAPRLRDVLNAYRPKLSSQTKVLEFDLDDYSARLFVQESQAPENVDKYTYRDGVLVGPAPEHWEPADPQRPLDWIRIEMVIEKTIPSSVENALAQLQLEGAVPSHVQILWWASDKRPLLRVYVDGARKNGSVDFDIDGKLITSEVN